MIDVLFATEWVVYLKESFQTSDRSPDRPLGGGFVHWLYLAYVAFLALAARHHQALPAFSAAMLSFVLPLTNVTLLVSLLRTQRAG